MGRAVKNLLGKIFGRLTVIALEKIENGMVSWRCQCVCGKEVVAYRSNLEGTQRSCGCWRRERLTTHGQSKTLRYSMLKNAQSRAREIGVPFKITLEDIPFIPDRCPVLDIPLSTQRQRPRRQDSPTLDRKSPALGYIPGNVSIISEKANRLKSNASPDELRKILFYLGEKI